MHYTTEQRARMRAQVAGHDGVIPRLLADLDEERSARFEADRQRDRLREAAKRAAKRLEALNDLVLGDIAEGLLAALAACEPASASLGVPSDTITIPAGTAAEQAAALGALLTGNAGAFAQEIDDELAADPELARELDAQ